MNAITKATLVAVLVALGLALAAGAAETPAAAVGRVDPLAAYWEAQWGVLSNHVAWANGPPIVPGIKEHRYKPILLKGGIPDAPYRPGEVDPGKVFLDNHCLIWEADRDALDVLLRRTRALAEGLGRQFGLNLATEAPALEKLETAAKSEAAESPRRKELFAQACALQRQIALRNPLLDFDEILFMTGGKGVEGRWQDVGFASGGGHSLGPFVLSGWKSLTPQLRRVLPDAYAGVHLTVIRVSESVGVAASHSRVWRPQEWPIRAALVRLRISW